MIAQRIESFVLRCTDPALTAAFYEKTFDAVLTGNTLQIGAERIHLATARGDARLAPANATSFQHFAIVISDIDAAFRRLSAAPGWSPITQGAPTRLPPNTGSVSAYKFRDPDGHPLEFLAFPPARTPPAWRGRNGLFLGIDHTAITVTDTQTSVAFYEKLGFRRSGGSQNEGPEQAALDALPAPVVEVTALALGHAPPHLELLCYRHPKAINDAREEHDPLATAITLQGITGALRDPDGHRLEAYP